MRLAERETIVAAWAEAAAGPGWANSPVWCVIRSAMDGSHRIDCFQPDEQTPEMVLLYRVSQAAHFAMTNAAERACRPPKAKKPRRK